MKVKVYLDASKGIKRVSSSQMLLIKCMRLIDHQQVWVLAVCWSGAFGYVWTQFHQWMSQGQTTQCSEKLYLKQTNKNTLELYLRLYRPQLPCYDSTIRRRLRLPLLSKKNKATSHRKRLFRVIAVKVVLQATEWWLYLVFHRTLWNCAYKSIQILNWKYIKCLPCIIVILYVLGRQSFYS